MKKNHITLQTTFSDLSQNSFLEFHNKSCEHINSNGTPLKHWIYFWQSLGCEWYRLPSEQISSDKAVWALMPRMALINIKRANLSEIK